MFSTSTPKSWILWPPKPSCDSGRSLKTEKESRHSVQLSQTGQALDPPKEAWTPRPSRHLAGMRKACRLWMSGTRAAQYGHCGHPWIQAEASVACPTQWRSLQMYHVSYYLLIFSREQCDAHKFLIFSFIVGERYRCLIHIQDEIRVSSRLVLHFRRAALFMKQVQWFRCCLCWPALWLIGAKAKDKPLTKDKPSDRVILSHSQLQSNLLWYPGCLYHHHWYGNSHSLLSKIKDESQKLLSMRSQQETHPKQRLFDLMSFISTIPPLVCSRKHTYSARWLISVSMSLSTIRISRNFSWIVKRLLWWLHQWWRLHFIVWPHIGLRAVVLLHYLQDSSSKRMIMTANRTRYFTQGSGVRLWEIPPKNKESCTSKNWNYTEDKSHLTKIMYNSWLWTSAFCGRFMRNHGIGTV